MILFFLTILAIDRWADPPAARRERRRRRGRYM
nr:MAG TPA: chitin synthase regulator [Bacteriophage sp.]